MNNLLTRRGRAWTSQEIEVLKQLFPKKGPNLEKELKRSEYGIYVKAKELGLVPPRNYLGERWTEKELNILNQYKKIPIEELMSLLPGRSRLAIMQQFRKIKINKIKKTKKPALEFHDLSLNWGQLEKINQLIFLTFIKEQYRAKTGEAAKNHILSKMSGVSLSEFNAWKNESDSRHYKEMPLSKRRLLYLEIKYGISDQI